MNTFLTVYFWLSAIASLLSFGIALFTPVKPAELWHKKSNEEFYKSAGQVLLAMIVVPLFAAPLVYLQWHGLRALGFAPWLAVVAVASSVIVQAVRVPQVKKSGLQPYVLPLWSLLLAWYGLQVLQ